MVIFHGYRLPEGSTKSSKALDHDLVLKPKAAWGSPILKKPHDMVELPTGGSSQLESSIFFMGISHGLV